MNVVDGTESSEVLLSMTESNFVNGLGGNDTLRGSIGDDTLDGGIGFDILTGGEGSDFFVLEADLQPDNLTSETSNFYSDIITDFSISENEQDILVLPFLPDNNRANFSDLVFRDIVDGDISGTEIQIEFDGDFSTIALLPGIASTQLDNPALFQSWFRVPETISPEAQATLRTFSVESRDALALPNDPNNLTAFENIFELTEQAFVPQNEAVVEQFNPTLTPLNLGGVPVIDVKPQEWQDNGKVIVYLHGGAYTLGSAESTLVNSVPIAEDTATRVIAVDYTRAPFAQFDEITNQVISVITELQNQGYQANDIALFGDSAGGSLATGTTLKIQELGLEQPGALVLWSPWSDITENGDTYTTLENEDPILNYDLLLEPSANAYAPTPEDKLNPIVSPVNGDYSEEFPPTLIQGGTKEILLSNFIRQAQVIEQADGEVELDIYDGMWHVFQSNWELPESQLARSKVADFLEENLFNNTPLSSNNFTVDYRNIQDGYFLEEIKDFNFEDQDKIVFGSNEDNIFDVTTGENNLLVNSRDEGTFILGRKCCLIGSEVSNDFGEIKADYTNNSLIHDDSFSITNFESLDMSALGLYIHNSDWILSEANTPSNIETQEQFFQDNDINII